MVPVRRSKRHSQNVGARRSEAIVGTGSSALASSAMGWSMRHPTSTTSSPSSQALTVWYMNMAEASNHRTSASVPKRGMIPNRVGLSGKKPRRTRPAASASGSHIMDMSIRTE